MIYFIVFTVVMVIALLAECVWLQRRVDSLDEELNNAIENLSYLIDERMLS